MKIRNAETKDTEQLITLLHEVLELHARIRPDIFRSGTTKYTSDGLARILADDSRPIYVAVDDEDRVLGYAFCQIEEPSDANHMVPFRTMYIDDLCVNASRRREHIGEQLFEHVKSAARRLGCYEITLHVWSGNDAAEHFYESRGMRTKKRQMEFIL